MFLLFLSAVVAKSNRSAGKPTLISTGSSSPSPWKLVCQKFHSIFSFQKIFFQPFWRAHQTSRCVKIKMKNAISHRVNFISERRLTRKFSSSERVLKFFAFEFLTSEWYDELKCRPTEWAVLEIETDALNAAEQQQLSDERRLRVPDNFSQFFNVERKFCVSLEKKRRISLVKFLLFQSLVGLLRFCFARFRLWIRVTG